MSRIYCNEGWQFTPEFQEAIVHEDCRCPMEEVRIPHTCKELPFHYFHEDAYQMLSGYRKTLFAEPEWEGKSIVITFEGVAHRAVLYVNGKEVLTHNTGYTAFSFDLTEHLNYGRENVIALSVDSRENLNTPPFGFVIDYMTYGGIYRDVYLDIREKTHIADVFHYSRNNEVLFGEYRLSCLEEGLSIQQLLVDLDTNQERVLVTRDVEDTLFTTECKVEDIVPWNLDIPKLYEVKSRLFKGNQVLDEVRVTFGFREASFQKDGFYLNGVKTKIRGLNRHQSYPYVGYAMPESMEREDARILKKELGCNAVRTSHYPQSHYFIDECDKLGLLVFTEIPGWQHIGDEAWKNQAVENVKEMVLQYRNHPSIVLWGVRINESQDDDEFYKRTNEVAHQLDPTRQTGGVRCFKKSHLFEDVYTYNDFSYDGNHRGVEPKKNVTSDMEKGYLVSEYNGHMYPSKSMDWEEHRVEHALRHATVLDEVNNQEDIAGSFGWCMFDYNTHKDFGSGDRICYHGVMDMFRNPKLAAYIYSCEGAEDTVLELSSSMDIGEHPGCNRGATYIITNADSVRMYKNDIFIKEYTNANSTFKNLKHGPILIDDFIGNQIKDNEDFTDDQAESIKYALNYTALHGYGKYPLKVICIALRCMLKYHMKPEEAVVLFNKYIGDWGGTSTVYRFEAVKDGKVVKTMVKEPMKNWHLETVVSANTLVEANSYDVAAVRIRVCDDNHNVLPFFQESIKVQTEGPISIIGPDLVPLRGGMAGVYVKTTGEAGDAKLRLCVLNQEPLEIPFVVKK